MGRKRSRSSLLEDLFEWAWRSQLGAVFCAGIGAVLISNLPHMAILAYFPPVDVNSALQSGKGLDAMMSNGFGGGFISLLPGLRLIGLVLLVVAGSSMLTHAKDENFHSPIRSAAALQIIGGVLIAAVTIAVFTNGLYAKPIEEAAASASQHAAGIDESSPAP